MTSSDSAGQSQLSSTDGASSDQPSSSSTEAPAHTGAKAELPAAKPPLHPEPAVRKATAGDKKRQARLMLTSSAADKSSSTASPEGQVTQHLAMILLGICAAHVTPAACTALWMPTEQLQSVRGASKSFLRRSFA